MARKVAGQSRKFARISKSGCLVCVALLWALLLAGWCLSGAKVTQRRQWRWRGSSRSFSSIWASVWGEGCLSKGGGPVRKDLKGDNSVIAGCGIGRERESMCQLSRR